MISNVRNGSSTVNHKEQHPAAGTHVETVPAPEQNPARLQSTEDLRRAELQGEEYSISEEQLVKAIEQAIKKIEGRSTSLSFSVHDQTKRIMVKVIDKESGEVIREVPPEKNLDFLASLWQMAGILIDEKR